METKNILDLVGLLSIILVVFGPLIAVHLYAKIKKKIIHKVNQKEAEQHMKAIEEALDRHAEMNKQREKDGLPPVPPPIY